MPILGLYLFGSPHVELDRQAISIERRKTLALLAYLAVSGTRQQRDALAVFFWPEFPPDRSRSNLRREIFTLNSAIGNQWLDGDRNTVGLSPGIDLWVDVLHFQKILASNQNTGEAARLTIFEKAAQLYRGDFMAGFSLPNCPDFEEWQFFQREHLRSLFTTTLEKLSTSPYPPDEVEKAIGYALQWVMADPLNEAAYQLAIRLYLQAGQVSAAKAQYERCITMFKKELQIEPSAETKALYQQIVHHQYTVQRASTQTSPVRFTLPRPVTLPKNLTPFIGRENEIEQISGMLPIHRLITLTGSGGIGKTRLSIQVAEKATDHFVDGVWFVDLSLIIEHGLVEQAVATSLGLNSRALRDPLLAFLEGKKALIVLDNCEHLISECAHFVEMVIQHCERVHFLATSREVLDLPGETVFRVPSLSIPPLDLLPALTSKEFLEALKANESVQVFSGRARAVQPSFEVTGSNALSVARICRRLDGIPLAIELAAARLNILTADELSERLENAFHLLTGGSRTALPRHRTLRATIDWSYTLLTQTECRLFASLSVFTGGCTLEAIEAVCGGSELGDKEILNTLSSLVNKSMVNAVQSPDLKTRYYLLEVIRQFALEKLIEAGEEADRRLRHLQHYTAYCEMAEPHLRSALSLEWTGRLRADLDNIRAAVYWAYNNHSDTSPLVEYGLRITVALVRFFHCQNLKLEEEEWLDQGCKFIETGNIQSLLKARFYYSRGNAEADDAMRKTWLGRCIEESQSAGEEAQSVLSLALVELSQSYVWDDHDLATARALVLEGVETARRLGPSDLWYLGQVLWIGSSVLLNDPADHDLAFRMAEESVHIMQQVGDRGNSAGLHTMGNIEAFRGNLDRAIQIFEEELDLYAEGNVITGIIFASEMIAWIHVLRSDFIQAFHIQQANLRYSYPNPSCFCDILHDMSVLFILHGQRLVHPSNEALFCKAAVLLGAYERHHRWRFDYGLAKVEIIENETIEYLHRELPTEQYSSAYAEGFAMSLDQAMTFASSITL